MSPPKVIERPPEVIKKPPTKPKLRPLSKPPVARKRTSPIRVSHDYEAKKIGVSDPLVTKSQRIIQEKVSISVTE